ncbi:DUF4245 domain-containing protein [Symbioplanes lichenis]|uniref:DUF4245 domain-containing protein n=1 Tax=Symbioplanes lichenis TaxID=1629072 RepID=UPI0027388633|nr:DUF4245 domain-containing protein [Actinoplanes lichenis]
MSSTEAPALGKRGERRPRDMALSLAVLLVPIALGIFFYQFFLDGNKPVTYDARPTLESARAAALFPVSEPQGLSDDWHVQSATFKRESTGATLRLGYSDPDASPVLLVESSVPTATLIPAELGENPQATATVRVGARAWQQYDGRPGETALVLLEKGRTILVIGSAKSDELEKFAAALP